MAERDRLSGNEFFKDYDYASRFINPNFLGRKMGQGLRARVYELKPGFNSDHLYGQIQDPREKEHPELGDDTYVIKIPRTESILPPSTTEKKLQDLQIGVEYFDPYIVDPTYVIAPPGQQQYCIIQKNLGEFENVTSENQSRVKEQLDDVIKRQQELIGDGMYLSLLGKDGLIACLKALQSKNVTPQMSNVVVQHAEDGPKVQIHDVDIFHLKRDSYPKTKQGHIRHLIYLLNFELGRRLIAHHFGYQLK